MKDIYIPAYTGAYNLDFITEKEFILSENSFLKHPYLLISAGHNLKMNINKYGIDLNKNLILGDSGGYQIATNKILYSEDVRKQIFEWLEKNTNYAMNLDFPPYAYKNSDYSTTFSDSLQKSIENFYFFQKNQSGKTKFLNVIHGQNVSDMLVWYNAVKDFDFNGGWSVGSIVGTHNAMFSIMLAFVTLFQHNAFENWDDKKILHILGFSKVREIIFVQYLCRKLKSRGYDFMVTYDSSSPGNLATRLQYAVDYSLFSGTKTITLKKDELDVNLCYCPVCKGKSISEWMEYNDSTSSVKSSSYVKLFLHNLYHILQSFQRSRVLAYNASKNQLKELLPTNDGLIIDCIDEIIDNKDDAIQTLLKYQPIFKSSSKTGDSVSLDSLF